MNNETFNQIVLIAQNAELINVMDYAELVDEESNNKAAIAKRILNIAFTDGINTEAYEQIKNAYNAHLKAAA